MSDLVLVRPHPQTVERIFTPEAWDQLGREFDVRLVPETDDVEAAFDALLPVAFAVVGQPDLPAERLRRATRLRALVNVEGNFYPNVDYPTAFAQGIAVLGCGPAYATAVAEYGLGLALDLARGISREDRAFRAGRERYVSASTQDSVLLTGSAIGLVGFGNLGRALLPLLAPFRATVRVYDPWLPAAVIAESGGVPAGLDEVLSRSQTVFVLATVTADSEHLLGAPELARLPDGAQVVLLSRAAVVDEVALLAEVATGRLTAAIDVWPSEPVADDHPARDLDGLVLSAHRAGGIPQAFTTIGDLVLDDLRLLARGLPPVRLQVAAPQLVGRYRNRPVT